MQAQACQGKGTALPGGLGKVEKGACCGFAEGAVP